MNDFTGLATIGGFTLLLMLVDALLRLLRRVVWEV